MIRRLVTLISSQAALLAQSEAAMKQAESASTAAKSLLAQRGEIAQNTSNEAHDKEVSCFIYSITYKYKFRFRLAEVATASANSMLQLKTHIALFVFQ